MTSMTNPSKLLEKISLLTQWAAASSEAPQTEGRMVIERMVLSVVKEGYSLDVLREELFRRWVDIEGYRLGLSEEAVQPLVDDLSTTCQRVKGFIRAKVDTLPETERTSELAALVAKVVRLNTSLAGQPVDMPLEPYEIIKHVTYIRDRIQAALELLANKEDQTLTLMSQDLLRGWLRLCPFQGEGDEQFFGRLEVHFEAIADGLQAVFPRLKED